MEKIIRQHLPDSYETGDILQYMGEEGEEHTILKDFGESGSPKVFGIAVKDDVIKGLDEADFMWYLSMVAFGKTRSEWEFPMNLCESGTAPKALVTHLFGQEISLVDDSPYGSMRLERQTMDFATPWTVDKYVDLVSRKSIHPLLAQEIDRVFGNNVVDVVSACREWKKHKDYLYVDGDVANHLAMNGWCRLTSAQFREDRRNGKVEIWEEDDEVVHHRGTRGYAAFSKNHAVLSEGWHHDWSIDSQIHGLGGKKSGSLHFKNFTHRPLGGKNTMMIFPEDFRISAVQLETGYGESVGPIRGVGVHIYTQELDWVEDFEKVSSLIRENTGSTGAISETDVMCVLMASISGLASAHEGSTDKLKAAVGMISEVALQQIQDVCRSVLRTLDASEILTDKVLHELFSKKLVANTTGAPIFCVDALMHFFNYTIRQVALGTHSKKSPSKRREKRKRGRYTGQKATATVASLIVEQEVVNSKGEKGYIPYVYTSMVSQKLGVLMRMVEYLRYWSIESECVTYSVACNILTNLCYAEENQVVLRERVDSSGKKRRNGKGSRRSKEKKSRVNRYKLLIDLDDSCLVDVKKEREGSNREGVAKGPHPRLLGEYYSAWVLPENVKGSDQIVKRGVRNEKERVLVERLRVGGSRRVPVNGWEEKEEVEETRREGTLSIF